MLRASNKTIEGYDRSPRGAIKPSTAIYIEFESRPVAHHTVGIPAWESRGIIPCGNAKLSEAVTLTRATQKFYVRTRCDHLLHDGLHRTPRTSRAPLRINGVQSSVCRLSANSQ